MALLLKIQPDALTEGEAIVPRMKSCALTGTDIGETVYVWLGDSDLGQGALHAVCTLNAISEITVPQTRNPARRKDAYRLALTSTPVEIVAPLTTEDLGPYRYVEGADGLDSLGRIHRDRNDKIIRLTGAEADVLQERFRH